MQIFYGSWLPGSFLGSSVIGVLVEPCRVVLVEPCQVVVGRSVHKASVSEWPAAKVCIQA
jgi:hypothetical protein